MRDPSAVQLGFQPSLLGVGFDFDLEEHDRRLLSKGLLMPNRFLKKRWDYRTISRNKKSHKGAIFEDFITDRTTSDLS